MTLAKAPICEEKVHLMEEFLAAASDLVSVHNDQMKAVIGDDPSLTSENCGPNTLT
jgi:hypothetical protein